MERLPKPQLPDRPADTRPRVIHISMRPRTWLGKVVLGIIGVVVTLVALFLSLVAFAIIASLVVVVIIYFLWATRRMRRAIRKGYIDEQPDNGKEP